MPATLMDKESSQIFSGITAEVKRQIPAWYGVEAKLDDSLSKLRRYPNSFIARFVVRTYSSTHNLLVKVPSKPYLRSLSEAFARDDVQERARKQFDALVRIWKAIEAEEDETLTAVKPLGYFAEWNAVVMTEIEGKILKKFLLHPGIATRVPKKWQEFQKCVRHSVRWLKTVHQRAGTPQLVPFPVDDLKDRIEKELNFLRQSSKNQIDIKSLQKSLFKLLEIVSKAPILTVSLHNDFQFSNILITTNGSACVLDASLRRRGPVYSDLSNLMIDPETRLVQVLSFGLFFPRRKLAQLQELILESYFQDSPINWCAIHLFCALAVLHKWAVDEKLFSSGGIKYLFSPIFLPILRFNFRRVLRPYLSPHCERNKA